MPYKDPEKQREYKRLYRLKNKKKNKEYFREYYLKNKEHMDKKHSENLKKYKDTEAHKKTQTISRWRFRGILCYDFNLLYDLFLSTNKCEYCECDLNICNKSKKCLDHDHSINDKFNIRGVICHSCNSKDVFK